MARTAAGLRQSGFEQAQAAAQSDLARQQQLGMFGSEQQQQRALQQAQLGQQAGIFGAELGQQRRMQQAQLQQQRQMGGLDIAGRAALAQPSLEMQARQQRAGLLGGLQGQQIQQLGLLGGAGAQQQALQQRAIDAQRGEFQRALGYGPQQIGLLQAGMGTPLISQTTTGQQKTGLGDVLGTAAQLAGMYFMGPTSGSDKRMKKDITFIGKEKGHNIYSWNWKDEAKSMGWDKYPTTGVLAQEVIKYMPEAVTKNANGYYMVNYGVL
jgi:hypothetical protein